MQIKSLHFHPFGPFEDLCLNFSPSPLGLHIIYGHNEAGKSSSLRAVSDLLFGFLHKTADNWQFENNKLCISADLLLSNDTSLQISRFKRRKNDLIERVSNEPLHQQILTQHLGGLERDSFLNTFGISHESLRLGVESILAAGGDLGQTLFAATSGINQLNSLMKRLEEKQAALFSPNARKPLINSSIGQIKEASQALRQATVSHDEWLQQKKDLEALSQQDEKLQSRLEHIGRQILEKKRYLKGLEALPSYRELVQSLEKLSLIPSLEKDFSHNRIETQTALKEIQQQKSSLEKRVAELKHKLDSLSIKTELINNRLAIEKAAAEAEVHRKAHNDDQGIRARIHLIEEHTLRQLDSIRPGLTLESLETLQLSSSFLQQVQLLQKEKIQLDQHEENTRQNLQDLDLELKKLQKSLHESGTPHDISELSRTYSFCVEQASLENMCHELGEEVDSQTRHASDQLMRLGLWQGELKRLLQLPVPLKESVRIYAEQFQQVEQNLVQLNEKIQQNDNSKNELKLHLSALTQGGTITTPEDLAAERSSRDSYWQSIKDFWLTGKNSPTQSAENLQTAALLAQSLTTSLQTVDKIADELIHHGERTARIENITGELDKLAGEKEQLESRKEEFLEQHQLKASEWKQLWSLCQITPLSPQEMLSWLDRYQDIKNALENLDGLEHRFNQATSSCNDLCAKLHKALRPHLTPPQGAGLRQLLHLAKEIIDATQTSSNKLIQMEEREKEYSNQSVKLRQQLNTLLSQKDQWQTKWHRTIDRLDFPQQTPAEEIIFFLNAVGELLQHVQSSKELQIRSDAIHRDYQKYTERLQQLDTLLATGLSSLDPIEAAYQLHSLLIANLDKQKDKARLQDELNTLKANLELAVEKSVSYQEKIDILCKQAKVSSIEELYEVEEKAQQKLEAQARLENLSAQVKEIAAGQDLETFFTKIGELDGDRLTLALENLEKQQQDFTAEHRDIVEKLAVARQKLLSFSSDDDATILAEGIESLRLAAEEQVEHYLTLKTASAILVKAIEEYRKHNQNPVLELASMYFRELTEESFTAVRADFDEKGRPVLKAERSDGSKLAIEEMSDGSRDQLFLALRLGGLARHIDKNGPMPFIVDDILVHFDDKRSLAALHALHKLGQKTQIIFFTHHRHLVSLCEQLQTGSHLQIHSL